MVAIRSVVVTLLATLPAVAQDKPPEPAPDPKLPGQLQELRKLCSDRKMEEDFRAISLIRRLAEQYPDSHPKDQAKIAKAMYLVFHYGPARPPGKDVLYREAATALSVMGADGGLLLEKLFDHDRIDDREYADLRAHILLQIGKTRSEKQIELLLEQARRSPFDRIMAAAGEALGNYAGVDIRTKRDIVDRLLIKYGEVDAKARQPQIVETGTPYSFTAQNARETLEAIQSKWNATLTRLTGQTFTEFPDWQHWHNKNPDWEPRDG